MKKTVSLLLNGRSTNHATTTYMVVNTATGRVSKHNYSLKRMVHAYHVKPYRVSIVDDMNAIVDCI